MAGKPLAEFPRSKEEVVKNVDLVMFTLAYPDHCTPLCIARCTSVTNRSFRLPIRKFLQKEGFTSAETARDNIIRKGITITRTGGEFLKPLGNFVGFFLQAEGQLTLYIVGESIWIYETLWSILKYDPN